MTSTPGDVPATDTDALRDRRRRLREQVRADPRRLDLRAELAAAYRAEGNASQAGRWDYLSEDADPGETAAFVRSCRHDPVEIMRALRWTGSEEDASTEVARERLRAVRTAARDVAGRRVTWEQPVRDDAMWPFVLGCAGVVLVLALAVVGGVATVGWLVERF